MRILIKAFTASLAILFCGYGLADESKAIVRPKLAESFPPSEDQGGWPTLLPADGEPTSDQKAKIRETAKVYWDRLRSAWEHNAAAGGATGLIVIRAGQVVGEWYKDCDRKTDFNIYSSSKAYTSTAYGLIVKDFGAPSQTALTLDTKVCNSEWIPESLPLPDPRKAEVTVRHLLNMAGGLSEENPPKEKPFEWSLGHVDGSPMTKLKDDPGKAFHYSNAGVSHLVLLFPRASGTDLYPFMKKNVFDPVGMQQVRWQQIGGDGAIGPFSQGYSGVMTTAREHARFCHLALHRGVWAGKRIVPDSYYDFAWSGISVKPDYGAQWWVYPHHKNAPRDLVQTAGARNNHGYVIPSLDLVFVRVGDGEKYPPNFESELVARVLAAVEP